jgi:prepilin-type N-terminal cleavage/methylation domain-containing protein
MKKGYTLAETLVVMGIILVLALISVTSFVNRRSRSQLASTASTMAGLLREAQSRSVSQSSSTAWGVHFENSATMPFFALFASPYSSSAHAGYYPLPASVGYATSSVGAGSYAEVVFTQISGAATGSSSISIYLRQGGAQVSSTLSISPAGSVSY